MNPRTLLFRHAEVRIYPDLPALTTATTATIIELGRAALAQRQQFDLALAGGSTPRGVYRHLAAEYASSLSWDRVHLFFGDERHVPPDHPDSNYRMVRESLLANTDLQPQVHRIESELEPGLAADRYEADLRAHFHVRATDQPSFDLILLGMGTDGHTASLFPGTSALHEVNRAVVANAVPQLNTHRITLTFPCLNSARHILFLTAGADKATMLAKVLRGDPAGTTYPAQSVQPRSGRAVWMIDEAAAQTLG